MEAKRPIILKKEKGVVERFIYSYLPYWPLFALLLVVFLVAGSFYLYLTKPIYEISADILIKDEKKGADESKILDALNIYSSNKIVENEIEVIQSKELLKKVVNSLSLYAPVFEATPIASYSAFTSSPVTVELADPDMIVEVVERIDFTYNKIKKTIDIAGKSYPLDQWVTTSFGTAKFNINRYFKTATTNNLYFSLVPPKQALNSLILNLNVSPINKLSSVIHLTIKDEVTQRGKEILNLLISEYNQAAINDKNLLTSNTLSFVETRIKYVVRELDSIENQLRKFKTDKGVVDISEQGRLYLQNVGDNDRKMTEVNMEMAMLNEVEKYVQAKDSQIGIVPSIAGLKDPLLAQLLQRYYDAQMQYERLRKTIPGGNPIMFSLRNEIDKMKPTILENIQNQRVSMQASKSNLSASTGTYNSMLHSIPGKERDLLNISRQQTIKNAAYSFLLQKREETALANAATVADSRIIDHPEASFLPVSPKVWLIFLGAFALSMISGVIFISGKELLTNKILFRTDIEAITNAPIVAEVINVKGKKKSFIINNTIKEAASIEQFRHLRANLGLNNRQLENKKILVTSSVASEGKTFISNNLALSIANSGRKVVLIDFDLRNPKTTGWYKKSVDRGIADFLERSEQKIEDIIYTTDHPKLFLIPAGKSRSNPTELLLNADLSKLFDYLINIFDFIIIDSSPIDPVTDAYILSEYCNSTLFVVRHDFTTKAMVELLDASNKVNALRHVSIVFNGIKPRGFLKKGYGSGFGYGLKKVYSDSVYEGQSTNSNV
ncbi:GumC family protein [Segetibacter aerophilus]|uniref:non-specific protein-tyrosine kinase n=1 Tax=Segetibacter aerophilus TaxID=670293 RepID=A0A512B879_9BACT|nr:polysaccharide biosynthesis tyrosine autokinase [Segetibacter aerophilus]GEO08171.1 tyrosine protein kinase [Segetibacter aerophilus]